LAVVLVDVGKGTQDILIPLKGKTKENFVKAVLPSPTEKLARIISTYEGDLSLCGYTMGGGPLKKAILEHIKKGYRVRATVPAAKSLRDDLSVVRKWGIEVVEKIDNCDLFLSDLDFKTYESLLSCAGVKESVEFVGVACQDHGFKKGQSDRITRFNYLKEILSKERNPLKLFHTEELPFFSRFSSIISQLRKRGIKGFVIDSKLAAVAGVISYAEEKGVKEFVCIDCGNGHTMVSTVKEGLICGFLEHHTKFLNPEKLEKFMVKLIKGEITFNEIYEDGGHGALFIEKINPEKIYLVGPNRDKFKDLGEFAYPLGDAMLFGCAGLLRVFTKYKSPFLY